MAVYTKLGICGQPKLGIFPGLLEISNKNPGFLGYFPGFLENFPGYLGKVQVSWFSTAPKLGIFFGPNRRNSEFSPKLGIFAEFSRKKTRKPGKKGKSFSIILEGIMVCMRSPQALRFDPSLPYTVQNVLTETLDALDRSPSHEGLRCESGIPRILASYGP